MQIEIKQALEKALNREIDSIKDIKAQDVKDIESLELEFIESKIHNDKDKVTKEIEELVSKLSFLKELSIRCYGTSKGDYLAFNLDKIKSDRLTYLNLNGVDLSDSKKIAKLLEKEHDLETIDLANSNIEDASFLESIQEKTTTLMLKGNPLNRESSKYILALMKERFSKTSTALLDLLLPEHGEFLEAIKDDAPFIQNKEDLPIRKIYGVFMSAFYMQDIQPLELVEKADFLDFESEYFATVPRNVLMYLDTNVTDVKIRILNKMRPNDNLSIEARPEQLLNIAQKVSETFKEINIVLKINDASELDLATLAELEKIYNIKEVQMTNENQNLSKNQMVKYPVLVYKKARANIDEVLSHIDFESIKNDKDREKQLCGYIANYLGKTIIYKEDERKEDVDAKNLKGALLDREATSQGIAEAFRNVLAVVGIKSIYIEAPLKEEKQIKTRPKHSHSWNQVELDGTWYNCDLAWSMENILNNENAYTMFKSDEEFKEDFHQDYELEANDTVHICEGSLNKGQVDRYIVNSRLWDRSKAIYEAQEIYDAKRALSTKEKEIMEER